MKGTKTKICQNCGEPVNINCKLFGIDCKNHCKEKEHIRKIKETHKDVQFMVEYLKKKE